MQEVENLGRTAKRPFVNLTRQEQKALDELRKNADIIIKPADKGGAVVLLTKEGYNLQCLDLLSDQKFYRKLTTDPTKRLQRTVELMVEEAEVNQWVSQHEATFLKSKSPRVPYFYSLPKIHKNRNPPPGRPIVSGIGSVLEPLSQFADQFLKPLVQKTPTYLKDTRDLLNLLDGQPYNENTMLLVGLDVESLYTSLPQQKTMDTLEDILFTEEWNYRTPRHFVLECCRLALTENYFEYEGTLFGQCHGTSMGSKFAPSVAGLYLSVFEQEHIQAPTNPFCSGIKLWRRYIDDVIMIWEDTQEVLMEFLTWINTRDDCLKFTCTADSKHLDFLDVTIFANHGTLQTKTFYKPTARNSMLSYKSFHPRPLRDNLPYGQFLRLRRNCSILEDYKKQAKELEGRLQERDYPIKTIRKCQKRARNQPRESLLETTPRAEPQDLLTCVTTYSTSTNTVKKIINKNWKILTSNTLKWPKPRFANKRTKNIKDILVHTRPAPTARTDTLTSAWNLAPITGHYPCGSCSVCGLTKVTKSLQLLPNLNWELRSHTNCNTTHVVYMIVCPCGLKYIGMTCRKIKQRIIEHKSNITCKKVTTKMSKHFIDTGHHSEDINWVILETLRSRNGDVERILYEKEQRWVHRLKTDREGLNDNIPWHALN